MTLADSSRFWMQGPRPLPRNGARGAHCGARHKAKARAVFDLRAPKCNLARAFICLRALMFLWRAPPAPWRVVYVLLTFFFFFCPGPRRYRTAPPHMPVVLEGVPTPKSAPVAFMQIAPGPQTGTHGPGLRLWRLGGQFPRRGKPRPLYLTRRQRRRRGR